VFSTKYCIEEILETAETAPEWEFLFVGEGPLEDDVRQAARTVENIYFPGAFEYRLMPGFLAHADVGFCFKDAEQPLKLKEYGAAGLPVIVRPGKLSAFHDEDELVFVDPDPAQIAAALRKLRTDQDLYAQYATAGETIASEWSWEEIAESYDELFQQIQ
jgi:glycosyltransferase involved in cell wall biosynthesis